MAGNQDATYGQPKWVVCPHGARVCGLMIGYVDKSADGMMSFDYPHVMQAPTFSVIGASFCFCTVIFGVLVIFGFLSILIPEMSANGRAWTKQAKTAIPDGHRL
jgi:hypothetical protein